VLLDEPFCLRSLALEIGLNVFGDVSVREVIHCHGRHKTNHLEPSNRMALFIVATLSPQVQTIKPRVQGAIQARFPTLRGLPEGR
jgi:hypothetical protein